MNLLNIELFLTFSLEVKLKGFKYIMTIVPLVIKHHVIVCYSLTYSVKILNTVF